MKQSLQLYQDGSTFERFNEWMAQVTNINSGPYSPAARAALIEQKLCEFKDVGLLSEIIFSIEQYPNHDIAEEIAARSYIHGNGFAKIVLGVGKNATKLRLHIWDPEAADIAEENIHDHRWGFTSSIVVGAIEAEYYVEDSSSLSTEYQCKRYIRSGDDTSLEVLGQIRLVRSNRSIYTAGDIYCMNPGTHHKIVGSQSKYAATLIVQSPPTRGWNDLITTRDKVQPKVQNKMLNTQELSDLLRKFRQTISEEI